MTAIMCSPVLYVCDSGTCGSEAMGTTARMPTGWREHKRTVLHRSRPSAPSEQWVGHLCPKCIPPEEP